VVDLMKSLAGMMVTSEFVANLQNGDPTPDAPLNKAEPADENPTIPAGYTYLGQFIDHDITFDPASALQRQNDPPDTQEDFRTPRLDLDYLYGRGLAWFDHYSYLFQMPRWTPAEEKLGLPAALDMLALAEFVN
jgi:hypothetical protein